MFDPVEKLLEFVRFPSVSTDPQQEGGMRGAREFLAGLLKQMGFDAEIVPARLHPVIVAERKGSPSWPGIIIYGHYDVQPADPVEAWTTRPFEPRVQGERLFGRGASDNKGPLLTLIAAVGRLIEREPGLPLRITFLIEGEEEVGSPSFPSFLDRQRHRLRGADFVLVSDTELESRNQAVITCGFRGLAALEVRVAGAERDLHSGIHGGALMNPIRALAGICASLHRADGRIDVPGFYRDIADAQPWEHAELLKLNLSDEAYRAQAGVETLATPSGVTAAEATRFLPTLEFNGIGGGYQGPGTKTVIPSRAFAKLSCRLVPNQDPSYIQDIVAAEILRRAPKGARVEVDKRQACSPYLVVPPGRPNTPRDQSPVLATAFRAADRAATDVWGRPPLYLRGGGSVPIIPEIKRALGLDSLMLGLCLPEDNLHAPDESFDLSVMRDAIEIFGRILREVAHASP